MMANANLALIDDLRRRPETSWLEFKKDNVNPRVIGKLISAISNAARLQEKEFGYVVWGVRDTDHAVVGTRFEPEANKRWRPPLELWLAQRLQPSVGFSFDVVQHTDGRLVLLKIPAATTAPVEFDHTAYIRIGSATPRLADYPERQRALWNRLHAYAWETGIARQFVNTDDVLSLLDYRAFFDLTRQPVPDRRNAILERLEREHLISPSAGSRWNVLNLGAILLANDLGEFESQLGRKAVRFIVFNGDGRTATVTHRVDFPRGYGSGFREVNSRVNALVPSPENLGTAVREANPLFPLVAIRN